MPNPARPRKNAIAKVMVTGTPARVTEADVWLLDDGTHLRPYALLGARLHAVDGVQGTRFAVWAPHASAVSVVGDFNAWDGHTHTLRLQGGSGVWSAFVPGVMVGAKYKFELHDRLGALLPLKADPYGLAAEMRPGTASVVAPLPARVPEHPARKAANALNAPVSIYEVHLASWRRMADDENRWLNWDELIAMLVPYAIDMGFTHLELLPISEHPFDGSWGYQPVGLYAPTARFGDAAGLRRFVLACHAVGLGVLLDWVPAHFPNDLHGLASFDGTHLYEHTDPREGFHNDWNTLIFNLNRNEVCNYLVGNALYWLECYGIDGLRIDAVSSMLYRDYSRKAGEWIPNVHGGRENLESIALLKRINEVLGTERPSAITLAEESSAFPGVSRPTYSGGLGFHYKWNMGWMNDTLTYMQRDPIHRLYHHSEMTFSMVYAYDEDFVLPISHDEVVHGKGSMFGKMPGDTGQKFANLRAYYGFMWGHPGKKLLFMGCEFGQVNEWNHDQSLDWHLLDQPQHAGLQAWVRDLNALLKSSPALYDGDYQREGFAWVDHEDAARSLLSFVRRSASGQSTLLVVCNFTPMVHYAVRLGVPVAGRYGERLNSDSRLYGGSGVGTGDVQSQPHAAHGHHHSVLVNIPPLSSVFFELVTP